ncbi:MAG TPA: DUF6065 family protein [Acetobacteraceae bacterium]|nr:DUF6065 family protein [Acetobacteraceae bacterium]
MASAQPQPLIRFHRLIPGARPPERADRSAGGLLPTRAFRYCEAVTSASAFGWYVFPPISFSLHWDGEDIVWTYAGAEAWYPLGRAQFPDFSAAFDLAAPEHLRGYAPPFVAALPEPGVVQVWSGLLARTQPGWSLLVRAPANIPRPGGYDLFEGIVETDRWFGPLFTNVRLTRTHAPVTFEAEMPLFQAQPLHRSVYSDERLNSFECAPDLKSLTEGDWADYRATVVKSEDGGLGPLGHNAAEIRKRRRNEPEPELE